MDNLILQPPDFLCQNIRLDPVKEILIHPVLVEAVLHLPVESFNLFQSAHPQLNLIQRVLQLLVGSYVFPQNIHIDFLFVQHIGIHKILNVVDWAECHGLGNQLEKFIFQPAETVLDHLPGVFFRGTPGLDFLSVACPELGNGFRDLSLKKHILLKSLSIHQIPDCLLLPLRSGIDYRSHNKIFLPFLLVKLQGHMGADLPCPLIGPVFPPGLTADISRQLPLAVLMGRFIEIVGRAGYHELYRIQQRGFTRTVFPRNQNGIFKFYHRIGKPVPVNQLHSRQFLHLFFRPFCNFPAFHMPA